MLSRWFGCFDLCLILFKKKVQLLYVLSYVLFHVFYIFINVYQIFLQIKSKLLKIRESYFYTGDYRLEFYLLIIELCAYCFLSTYSYLLNLERETSVKNPLFL